MEEVYPIVFLQPAGDSDDRGVNSFAELRVRNGSSNVGVGMQAGCCMPSLNGR